MLKGMLRKELREMIRSVHAGRWVALGFDRAKPQTPAFFEDRPLVVVCIGIEQHHAGLTRREFRRFFGDTDAHASRASRAEKCFSSQLERALEIVVLESARHAVDLG